MPLIAIIWAAVIISPALVQVSDALGRRIARKLDGDQPPPSKPDPVTPLRPGRTFDADTGIEIPPRPRAAAA